MELMDQTGSCSIRVIDLDDGSVRAISWDPNVPDQVFESLVESQLRAQFGVSDEAWVDLIDTANSSLVHITKDVLSNVKDSLCLCLSPKTEALAPMKTSEVFEVVFQDRALGMTIREHNESVIVNHFKRKPDGALGEAEASGLIQPNDVIYKVNGARTVGRSYDNVVQMLQTQTRPLSIQFFRPFRREGLFAVEFRGASLNMTITTDDVNVIVKDLPMAHPNIVGYAEAHGVRIFDIIHAVDGEVINGLEYNRAISLLSRSTRPMVVVEMLKDLVLAMRPDVCSAVKRKNNNAIVAIVRSPFMRLWDSLLKTRESILLAGPVSLKRKKRFHLLLTDHERLLFVNKDTNLLEDEIMCSQIVTVSSRSKYQELTISTSKMDYVLIDNFIGPVIWVRAILPFTCTQGLLKVASSRRFLGSKKRYFVLRGNRLTGYKKESMIHQVGAKSSTISLADATIDITDPRSLSFIITTPEFSQAGKKLILTATSTREYNKWATAFKAQQTTSPTTAA
ncbi:hypothetical protein PHYSODRAFT_359506 [Phytophthora sojae]|uniref:PH domain-containing protein n=1 Tax=Phytophthora sojae (strain P6497) TaxID=1094619 RepID=G4YWG1_PHYSP|nr:hypothetical protein PHYSODRAFT_359506 [Phytophthora sojae]EGZ25607.1 hypothetical protein PHYSODRAFT_359506 [Phytophthora sojae]|eukprot:XP_009520895.1 hypothetical protein PHYSODRAFT_359506 [Phytophthora sojae]